MILRPLFQWRPTGGGGCHLENVEEDMYYKKVILH